MKYSPVGKCIYCGKVETAQHRLTDEHILPSGLGGDLLLPKSIFDGRIQTSSL
jgi:hypothetical protein